jgi:hypothetical protein
MFEQAALFVQTIPPSSGGRRGIAEDVFVGAKELGWQLETA